VWAVGRISLDLRNRKREIFMSTSASNPFEAVALHVGIEDVPWVPNHLFPGTEYRLLQADVARGVYAMSGRLPGGLEVGTHRHTGAVHMFTLAGAWKYHEHEYVNRAGSYLYEPPDSVHTLYVLPGDETTETLSIVHGETEYLDGAGDIVSVSNAATNLANYYASCEQAGIPRPDGILR
jgi:2,4'-dihydroxyacetophenone dioxygenase